MAEKMLIILVAKVNGSTFQSFTFGIIDSVLTVFEKSKRSYIIKTNALFLLGYSDSAFFLSYFFPPNQ